MSLACLECGKIGSFDTLIISTLRESFDFNKPISEYANFYVCCAKFEDFKEVEHSKFMIIKTNESESCLSTGNDGELLRHTKHKYISREELRQKLPRMAKAIGA